MFCSVSLHFCTELSNHMHHGIEQGGSKARISSWTGSNRGQILIEMETHSLPPEKISAFVKETSL